MRIIAKVNIKITSLKHVYFFHFSNPTPALTDAITVAWEPLTAEKNQIYRISEKPSMDTEHKLDSIK